jgi:hypothetical protein
MKKKIIIFIIVWILIYLAFFKLLPYLTDKYHGCYIHEDIYKQNIKAVVSGKFIDPANHNNKTIAYSTVGHLGQMIFPGYLEDLYEYLNVGDSIIKEKSSIYYKVKSKATGKDTVFRFYTTCKDSLAKSH